LFFIAGDHHRPQFSVIAKNDLDVSPTGIRIAYSVKYLPILLYAPAAEFNGNVHVFAYSLGSETCQATRRHAKLSDCRLISPQRSSEVRPELAEALYVPKPINFEDLLLKLKKILPAEKQWTALGNPIGVYGSTSRSFTDKITP
jgi:hypothetical protein